MSKLAREELSGCSQGCVASNAEAARQASENFAIAAIAGQVSAAKYGLDIVHSHIEDKSDNRTRFLVLGGAVFCRQGMIKPRLWFQSTMSQGPC